MTIKKETYNAFKRVFENYKHKKGVFISNGLDIIKLENWIEKVEKAN